MYVVECKHRDESDYQALHEAAEFEAEPLQAEELPELNIPHHHAQTESENQITRLSMRRLSLKRSYCRLRSFRS